MRKEVLYLIDIIIVNLIKYIFQPRVWIDTMHFGGVEYKAYRFFWLLRGCRQINNSLCRALGVHHAHEKQHAYR